MKQNLTCVIIDDDPHAIEILEDYVSQIPMLTLRKSYTDPVQALIELATGSPLDLLLLDIDMPGVNGLLLADKLKSVVPNVIFTTGHSGYAREAFEVRAKHYLLKPISIAEFSSALAVVISSDAVSKSLTPGDDDSIYVRTGVRNERVKLRKGDIYLIESAANYVNIVTAKSCRLVYMMMKEMAEVLESDQRFYQIRKSAIINREFVDRVDGNTVVFKDIEQRPVISKFYGEKFLDYLNSRTLLSKRN